MPNKLLTESRTQFIKNEIKNNFHCHSVLTEHLYNGYTETINGMDFNAIMETIEIIRKGNGNQI